MLVASHFLNAQRRVGFQQGFDFEIDAVDRINLAGHQCIHAGRVVVDRDVFDLIKEAGSIALIMILHAVCDHAHTRVKRFNLVQACADTLGNRVFDHASRIHADVIVRHQIREISVARCKREFNLCFRVFLHLCDGFNNRLGS